MGFERVAIFGLLDVELESASGGLIQLYTDLPGNAMSVRETRGYVPTGRRVLRYRLSPATKGHLYSLRVTPNFGGVTYLYGARIWARILPGQAWDWYTVPVPPTGDWEARPLPIPPTSDWEARKLPIPGTSDWEARKLPIPPTSDWEPVKLPIKPTPPLPEWIDVPVDA